MSYEVFVQIFFFLMKTPSYDAFVCLINEIPSALPQMFYLLTMIIFTDGQILPRA